MPAPAGRDCLSGVSVVDGMTPRLIERISWMLAVMERQKYRRIIADRLKHLPHSQIAESALACYYSDPINRIYHPTLRAD